MKIDRLIINAPCEESTRHSRYAPQIQEFQLAEGQRSAGYVIASEREGAFEPEYNPSSMPGSRTTT